MKKKGSDNVTLVAVDHYTPKDAPTHLGVCGTGDNWRARHNAKPLVVTRSKVSGHEYD